MSPKTFKNKKESTDSKRASSTKIEPGSAPFSKFNDEPVLPAFDDNDATRKPDPNHCFEDMDEATVPPLRQDSEDEYDGRNKATMYFDTFAKAIIKVFSEDKQVMVFPMLVKNFMDRQGYFSSLRTISNCICDMIDSELERQGYYPFFTGSFEYEHGFACDLRIASHDSNLYEDSYMHEKNYEDMLFLSYAECKSVTLHVRVKEDIMRPVKKTGEAVKNEDVSSSVPMNYSNQPILPKEEKYVPESQPFMFRGRPIDMNAKVTNQDQEYNHPGTPLIHHGRTPVNDSYKGITQSKHRKTSPISVYDDEDYLVRDVANICPFGQQSVQQRIADLQAAATSTIPDVTTLPKLLKSHNVGFKDGDNAASWYHRFNDFCLMIGIYLPPPNAMLKDSEMGKEWDSNSLPYVFHSRLAKMEKVLSHILLAPDFFPKSFNDELQLNPKPYNFLRLFMALRSSSVPDLSDRIIKRPGPMKISQTLAQYALAWVNYFADESNVNGIHYSKFRQYCYFVDGISGRYTTIKKFLELEFQKTHDRHDNIPISLELRNIPTTIISLCQIHGISCQASTNIHQMSEQKDNCRLNANAQDDIKRIQVKKPLIDTNDQSGKTENPKVQCWLCDGPHSFRQCKELVRMKNICAQRPQVKKHFRQLLLDRNAPALKILTDAPDFFDDTSSTSDENQHEDTHPDDATNEQVNLINALSKDTFTTFDNGILSCDVTTFPESNEIQHVAHDPDNEGNDSDGSPEFYVLSLFDDCLPDEDAGNPLCQPEMFPPISQNEFTSSVDASDFYITDTLSELEIVNTDDIATTNIHSVSFASDHQHVKYHSFTTQVDGGADRCTTPHRTLVFDMRPPNPSLHEPLFVLDAGKHKHKVEGIGNFRIATWVNGERSQNLTIPCAYIPTIPSTLVNFRLAKDAIMYGEISNLVTNDAIGTLIVGSPTDYVIHKIPLKLSGQRVYASNLLSTETLNQVEATCHPRIAIVSDEATRLLWHARLGHLNFRALASMHTFAKGVPKFKQSHVLDQCGTCLETKLRRSPRGHGTIAHRAEVHGQIFCADWGFICQKSSDPTRITRLSSVYGDTSYLIFACAHTGALYGTCGGSKSVPTKWLHTFLHRISYAVGSRPKTILVDRGSELGRSLEFKKIVESHGYKLITSGPDKSSMNSLGERPHSTIGNALRSMLHACGLPMKYWNFAFYHFLRLFNFFPHGTRTKSPFEMIRGTQPDLSLLRIFGCHVYIRPPGRRPSKLDKHVVRGTFLGYTSTLKQIYYLEQDTHKIKVAAHARFDEGLANVPLLSLPPYAIQLRKALGHSVPNTDEHPIGTPGDLDLLSSSDLFPITFTHRFHIKASDITNENDTLGFILKDEPTLQRCFIADITPRSTAATYPRWRSTLIGAFILAVDDDIVFSLDDTTSALSRALVDSTASSSHCVNITFAHDRALIRSHLDPDPGITSPIQMDQICHISRVFETGEEIIYQPRLDIEWF